MFSSRRVYGVAWSACEVDGLRNQPLSALQDAMILRLMSPAIAVHETQQDPNRPAARNVVRMLSTIRGAPLLPYADLKDAVETEAADVTLTDGSRTYKVTFLNLSAPIMVWGDAPLPVKTDLYVLDCAAAFLDKLRPSLPPLQVICFSPGTLIRTPQGVVDIDHLLPGHLVQTRDDGPQPIEWMGAARITPAGLRAHPHLRPVRLKAGALGRGPAGWEPDRDLLVSPAHRVMLRGAAAQDLFGASEVLVAARDLVNAADIHVDHSLRTHRYIHMMLPRHAIVWANGLPVETFHPADMALGDLAPAARDALIRVRPDLEHNPHLYGASARRCLTQAESAILLGERRPRVA